MSNFFVRVWNLKPCTCKLGNGYDMTWRKTIWETISLAVTSLRRRRTDYMKKHSVRWHDQWWIRITKIKWWLWNTTKILNLTNTEWQVHFHNVVTFSPQRPQRVGCFSKKSSSSQAGGTDRPIWSENSWTRPFFVWHKNYLKTNPVVQESTKQRMQLGISRIFFVCEKRFGSQKSSSYVSRIISIISKGFWRLKFVSSTVSFGMDPESTLNMVPTQKSIEELTLMVV